MGNQESNESAAVKRQAEGGVNPMYDLLDLSGKLNTDVYLKSFERLFNIQRWRPTLFYHQEGDG